MAKAYPGSKFIGYDYHGPSIEIARKRAKEEGSTEDRITIEVDHQLIFLLSMMDMI